MAEPDDAELPTVQEMRAVYPSGLFRDPTDCEGMDSRTLRELVAGDGEGSPAR